MSNPNVNNGKPDEVDAVVIGAGFAGLYMVYRLREMGLSHRAFEKGGGVAAEPGTGTATRVLARL